MDLWTALIAIALLAVLGGNFTRLIPSGSGSFQSACIIVFYVVAAMVATAGIRRLLN